MIKVRPAPSRCRRRSPSPRSPTQVDRQQWRLAAASVVELVLEVEGVGAVRPTTSVFRAQAGRCCQRVVRHASVTASPFESGSRQPRGVRRRGDVAGSSAPAVTRADTVPLARRRRVVASSMPSRGRRPRRQVVLLHRRRPSIPRHRHVVLDVDDEGGRRHDAVAVDVRRHDHRRSGRSPPGRRPAVSVVELVVRSKV